jgi:FlaA1/EpsC-like NDP-sugar epimerase
MMRKHLILFYSIAAAAGSLLASFLLRFDFSIPASEWTNFYGGLWIFVSAKALVFYVYGRRRSLWSTVGVLDLLRVVMKCAVASAIAGAATLLLIGPAFPRSVYLMDAMIFFILMAGVLFSRRVYQELTAASVVRSPRQKPVLIYGAGAAGLTLARELRSNRKLGYRTIAFLDDDPGKQGASITAQNRAIRQMGHGGIFPR